MKLNSLLLILASGLAGVAVTSCGGSNGSSQASVLTPQSTEVTTPTGSTIPSGSTVAVGCANDACTLSIPTGSSFETFDAPADITSASQVASVQYENGNLLVVSTANIAYTVASSSLTSSANVGAVTYDKVYFPIDSSLFAIAINGSQQNVISGVSQPNGLIGTGVGALESTTATYAATPSQCVSSTSTSTSAVSGTGSNVAASPYAGVGVNNGQVCVYNITSGAFTNLTNYSSKAVTTYANETTAVNGLSFYQAGTSCSGYWYNTSGNIWGVNATCGSSTVTPSTFTQLNSTSSVSGFIPQNPTAIYADATNGLWVGGSVNGFAVIYYLTAGSNVWTSSAVVNSAGQTVQGTISAISGTTASAGSTQVSFSVCSSGTCNSYTSVGVSQ